MSRLPNFDKKSTGVSPLSPQTFPQLYPQKIATSPQARRLAGPKKALNDRQLPLAIEQAEVHAQPLKRVASPFVIEPILSTGMFYIRCSHNGKLNGGRFCRDEVDYLLARFGHRRDRVDDREFGDAAHEAVKLHYLRLVEVAA
ncbi:MAG: hypothetical protein WA949_13340 [Phormidesmis sp.]